MCFGVCDLPNSCDLCDDLLIDIILSHLEKINRFDVKVLKQVLDYVKKHSIGKKRKNGEPYIFHLIHTSRILLFISQKLTIEQIVVALLHDSIEDISEIDVNELTRLFGYKIALSVEKLSKKTISKEGISEEEYKILKRKRDIEYLEGLKYLPDFELDVKFADRIHNLRTLYGLTRDFVEKYIDETIIYYLPLARKRNKKAYDLIFEEIIKLIKYLQKDELDNIFNNLETRVPLEELA